MLQKSKKKDRIDEYEEKILKIKYCQSYHREGLEKLMNNKKYHVQERIDFIVKMYKLYENIYENYIFNLKRYINYLFRVSNNY